MKFLEKACSLEGAYFGDDVQTYCGPSSSNDNSLDQFEELQNAGYIPKNFGALSADDLAKKGDEANRLLENLGIRPIDFKDTFKNKFENRELGSVQGNLAKTSVADPLKGNTDAIIIDPVTIDPENLTKKGMNKTTIIIIVASVVGFLLLIGLFLYFS